jgi:hypothetical protein
VKGGDLPAPAPTPAAAEAAAAANQPHDEQEYQRPDRCVDDRRDNPDAKVNSELGQQPVANEGSYDSDHEIADESNPVPRTIWPANHPATRPTSSMTRRLWPDMYIFSISSFSVRLQGQLHAACKPESYRQ